MFVWRWAVAQVPSRLTSVVMGPGVRQDDQLSHAGEKRFFRRMHGVGGSDMHPYAVEPQAEQALLLIGVIEHPGQRKFAGWRIAEQRRRHDRGPGIDEGNHLMFPALAQS